METVIQKGDGLKSLEKEIILLNKIEHYFLDGNELCDKIIYSVMEHRVSGNNIIKQIKN